ncbi:MAG: precorrin-6Y C5,15-methyltransferase (decarboxylating) subunit CbiT [Halocynthiibacter sp.]
MSDTTISPPWLTIIGCGEDGRSGLTDASRKAIAGAKHIFGATRHLSVMEVDGTPFPVPFSVDPVMACRGEATVMFTSGDPFWYGAGGSIAAKLDPNEYVTHSAPSVFSMIAARMGWRIEQSHCFGLHATPLEQLRPVAANGGQIMTTLRDGAAALTLAKWLTNHGFGDSELTCFQSLGGEGETRHSAPARDFDFRDLSHPIAAAVSLVGTGLAQASGIPDDAFYSDGQITKRPIRALTLSTIAPRPNDVFWDIGAGSGSISVEVLLAAKGATAYALETRADRVENIQKNAEGFGLSHRMHVVNAHAPDGLRDLPTPDIVFIGGGITMDMFHAIWDLMPHGARLVANTVTLESEAVITLLSQEFGGSLMRADIAIAAPLGKKRGWKAARPVLQWSVLK